MGTQSMDFDVYMDQRIDHCLGQFRKKFAGDISTKALGPRGGDYGSFLPVYLRGPLCLAHQISASEQNSQTLVQHVISKAHTKSLQASPTMLAKRSKEDFESPNLDSIDTTSSVRSSLTIEEFNENEQKKTQESNDRIHVANILKEATKLRYAADHLKNGGEKVEIIGLYIHAAIKFLNGAFLLENMEGPIQIYMDSAKLSMYCATAFERIGEMAAAALAYKCVEVAYMRILFSMSSLIQRDKNGIQHSSLGQNVASTSNSSIMDNSSRKRKSIKEKEAGSMVIGNHPSLHGLLECSEYICIAMDATKKSWRDLSIAESSSISRDAIAAVRRTLEFHFNNLEEFLYLVRLALEKLGI